MSETKTLFDNEWLSLKEMRDPDRGVNGYVFAHETRCKGQVVLVLPFRPNAGGVEVLLRREVTPCWGMEPCLSGITGGVEDDDPAEDAVRELSEEAGYTVERADLLYLGTVRGSKAMDTVYHLYAVNLDGKEQGEAKGDGSALDNAPVEWHDTAANADDAVAVTAFARLVHALEHWKKSK
ncbi:MAG: NUDIX domain-containing protein [Armatimonadetes bacterium]|nr:NUDIX domain-containing protein [Armatimonadota bacterium]